MGVISALTIVYLRVDFLHQDVVAVGHVDAAVDGAGHVLTGVGLGQGEGGQDASNDAVDYRLGCRHLGT